MAGATKWRQPWPRGSAAKSRLWLFILAAAVGNTNSAARFEELSQRLETAGRATLWLAGEAEMERPEVAAALARRQATGRACSTGRPLCEVAATLAMAESYVGNDSGITHLAAAGTAIR